MPISAISPKFEGMLASDFQQISEILPQISNKFAVVLPPISNKSVDEMLLNIVNRFVVWLMCRNFVG